MDLPEEAKRAPSAPVWNQSFPSPKFSFSLLLVNIYQLELNVNTAVTEPVIVLVEFCLRYMWYIITHVSAPSPAKGYK